MSDKTKESVVVESSQQTRVILPLNLLSRKEKKRKWGGVCKHKKLRVVKISKPGDCVKKDKDGAEWICLVEKVFVKCDCGMFGENAMVGVSRNDYVVGDYLKKEDRGWVVELQNTLKSEIMRDL